MCKILVNDGIIREFRSLLESLGEIVDEFVIFAMLFCGTNSIIIRFLLCYAVCAMYSRTD